MYLASTIAERAYYIILTYDNIVKRFCILHKLNHTNKQLNTTLT